MQVHFTARGNFRPLEASLRGLNAQMNRSMSGMGRGAMQNVANPINDMSKAFRTGRFEAVGLGTALRNQGKYIREHNALMNAKARVYRDAAGGAQVFMDVNRNAAANAARLGQRIAFTNSALHTFGRQTIATGKNMQWAGRQVMVGLTLPLTLLAGAAVKTAEAYDKQMTRVIKVNSEASAAAAHSEQAFNMVSDSIRRQTNELVDFGANMGFAAEETSRTIAEFAQMGYVGASLDQLTEAATTLSRVSGTDLETAIAGTRIAAQAFNIDLKDLTETFARLNLVENNTALSLDEMMIGMPVVAAVANALGLQIEETAGLMAMMKEAGISGKEGATALRTGLLQLVQEATDPTREAFAAIGLDIDDMKHKMQTIGGGDPLHFFDQLSKYMETIKGNQPAMNDLAAALSKLFGVRQTSRVLSFLDGVTERYEKGSDAYRAFIGVHENTAAEDALRIYQFELDQIQNSAAGTAETLRAQLNVEMARLGENFLDVANAIRRFGVNALRWFNNLDDRTKKLVLTFGTLIAALGPVTMLAGVFANAFGQIITLLTRFGPKMNLATMQTQAMEKAYMASAKAIDAENASLARNIGLRNGAAGAAGRNAAATGAATGASTAAGTGGGAAAGAAGGAAATQRGIVGRLMTGIGAALMLIPKMMARGVGAIVGPAMRGITAAVSSIGAKMLASKGAMSVVAGGAMTAGGKLGLGGLGAAAGGGLLGGGAAIAGVAALAAAIAAIPILADPQAFMAKFMAAIEGPMNRFRDAWSGIQEQAQRLFEIFRQNGGEGSGLSRMAEIIGQIAGWLGGIVVDAIGLVVKALGPVIAIVEAIVHFVSLIGSFFDEGADSGEIFLEMVKAIGRALMEVVAWVLDAIAAVLRAIPGLFNDAADAVEGWGNELRNIEVLQSSITDATVRENQARRELEKLTKSHKDALAESQQFAAEIKELGIDVYKITREELMANELISDEMRAQIMAAQEREEIEKRIKVLLELQGLLVQRLEAARDAGRAGEILYLEREIAAAKREHTELLEKSPNLVKDFRDEMQRAREVAGLLGDDLDGADDSMYGLGRSTKETEAAMKALEARAADLRDRIQESERAAQEWASSLQSAMRDVMRDIASAVRDALEDQISAQQEAFNEREEQIKSSHEAQIQAIEDAADAELKRLDDIKKREEEQEAMRKRFFEQEKARITYLKNMEQENVSMQEAIARGDVGEAARIRIGLQAEAERYMLESYEREAEKYRDARDKELEAKRESIDETRKAQVQALKDAEVLVLKQLDVERKAAEDAAEARRRSIELYLKDWERITPATEAEFRRHLGNLTSNMERFGVSMADISGRYTTLSGNIISNGFTNAVNAARRAIAESDKWRQVGESSGKSFRDGLRKELEKVEADLEALRSGANINRNDSPTDASRFNSTAHTFQWGDVSHNPITGTTGAVSRPSSSPTTQTRLPVNPNGGIQFLHSGGAVRAQPMPGLKRDEKPAILQHGEFVVQADAVAKVGRDYMERLNNVHRFHDGGIIDHSTGSIKEGGMMKSISGYASGMLADLAAKDFLHSAGITPSTKSSYTSAATDGEKMGRSAGKQIADIVLATTPYGTAAGWGASAVNLPAGPAAQWTRTGGWPPRQWATLSANTRAARDFWRAQGANFPGGIGDGVHRGVASSDHSWGKALDFMVAPLGRYANDQQKQVGWQVANWHLQNPGAFGTKYVIWDRMINSGDSRGWREYTRYGKNPGPTLGHYDHVHVSYLHDGGMVMPSMRTGGKIKMNNTVANLHKGERVLTEPSTRALESAIQNFARNGGQGNTYNLEINVDGANIDEKALAKKVVFEIDKLERSKGRKRVVGK